MISGLDDLRLVVFAKDWPAQVTPWVVPPTNCTDFVNLSNVMAVWYRQNTGKMNLYSNFWQQGLEARVANPCPGIPFFEPTATGGDSGSPAFFVLKWVEPNCHLHIKVLTLKQPSWQGCTQTFVRALEFHPGAGPCGR